MQLVPCARPSSTVPVAGSLTRDRMVVPDSKLRNQLRQYFTSEIGAGLPLEQYREAVAACDESLALYMVSCRIRTVTNTKFDPSHCPLQENPIDSEAEEVVRAPHAKGVQLMLRSLMSSSPSCTVLPYKYHEDVGSIVEGHAVSGRHLLAIMLRLAVSAICDVCGAPR